MTTYVLTVSRTFPKTHSRYGEPTFFMESILKANDATGSKIHTIRTNYELWVNRAKRINSGEAVLSIRYWSGEPYKSKQVEFMQLTKIGVQKLDDPSNFVFASVEGTSVDWELIAKNDGLSFEDFCEWFKVRTNNPMAIIHFTDFRYTKNQ